MDMHRTLPSVMQADMYETQLWIMPKMDGNKSRTKWQMIMRSIQAGTDVSAQSNIQQADLCIPMVG